MVSCMPDKTPPLQPPQAENLRLGRGPCCRPHEVEKHSEPTPQVRGREADERRSRKKGPQKGAQPTPTDQRPHTKANSAAETVSPTSVSTATSNATTIKLTGQPGFIPMIKLDRRRPYLDEWSCSTGPHPPPLPPPSPPHTHPITFFSPAPRPTVWDARFGPK